MCIVIISCFHTFHVTAITNHLEFWNWITCILTSWWGALLDVALQQGLIELLRPFCSLWERESQWERDKESEREREEESEREREREREIEKEREKEREREREREDHHNVQYHFIPTLKFWPALITVPTVPGHSVVNCQTFSGAGGSLLLRRMHLASWLRFRNRGGFLLMFLAFWSYSEHRYCIIHVTWN